MNRFILCLFVAGGMGPAVAAEPAWMELFNGRDLDGWVQRGGGATYSVEDGTIVGRSVPNTPNTFLCTEREFGDFVLEFDFKVDPRLNSGVQIRSEVRDEVTEVGWRGGILKIPAGRVFGYQVEIDPTPGKDRWWTAGIFDEGRRGWLYPGLLGGSEADFTEQGRGIFKSGEWNSVRVEAIGDSIRTWLNGGLRAEIIDGMTPRGFIGLQIHGIGGNEAMAGAGVAWRNLRLREVGDAPVVVEKADSRKEDQ